MDFYQQSIEILYKDHVEKLHQRYARAIEEAALQGVLIDAGTAATAFLDDQTYPFKVNPHFKAWLPLLDNEHSMLLVRPGERAKLFYYQADDYWHKSAADPAGFWTGMFDIHPVRSRQDAHKLLGSPAGIAFIGDNSALAEEWNIDQINPQSLLNPLHFERISKTAYEKRCILEASRIGVQGHRAARDAFTSRASEFEIQHAFLAATRQREQQNPYTAIVAINENSAILHYQHYERSRLAKAHLHSMLIDAGADYHGYAADITRTYAFRDGLFRELIDALDREQLELIDTIECGGPFLDIHSQMQLRIARLLKQFKLTDLDPEDMLTENLTFNFMPHGLGHYLGLQTHDVGGYLQDRQGRQEPPPDAHPTLRITRPIEDDQVFTIEPGIYFIPSLLQRLRESKHASRFNWNLIESLMPCGGIRIEDNICIDGGKIHNLTRTCFHELDSTS